MYDFVAKASDKLNRFELKINLEIDVAYCGYFYGQNYSIFTLNVIFALYTLGFSQEIIIKNVNGEQSVLFTYHC